MPEDNVVRLADRFPSFRPPSFEISPDLEELVVTLKLEHPTYGTITAGLEPAQVVKMMEGLLWAGAKVASTMWMHWCGHVHSAALAALGPDVPPGPLPEFREAAFRFVKVWKNLRPNVLMTPPPARDVVQARVLHTISVVADERVLRGKDGEAFRDAVCAHLSVEGFTLALPSIAGEPVESASCGAANHRTLPWDHLL